MKKCFRKNIERKILFKHYALDIVSLLKGFHCLELENIVSKKHIVVTGDIVPKICYIVFVINKIAFSFSFSKKKKK